MKFIVSWSGGKDCLMALEAVMQDPALQVQGLLTTVSEAFDRVSMHGVRRTLLEAQAAALELPLTVVRIPVPMLPQDCPLEAGQSELLATTGGGGYMNFPPNDTYVPAVRQALCRLRDEQGIAGVVCGDIFLADLKAWRDELLGSLGLCGVYPLWQQDSRALLAGFVERGYRAQIVCLDHQRLGPRWLGAELASVLSSDYPADCDLCGENGEYHSFVHAGPLFRQPVAFRTGQQHSRANFSFLDLIERGA